MAKRIADFLLGLPFIAFLCQTTAGQFLTVFIVGMVPLIELRGAIPIGEVFGLHYIPVFIVAFLGNMLPIPFVILFIRRILEWTKKHLKHLGGFVRFLENKAQKNSEVVKKYEKWGLFILVAIPLPGTGAWTGALVASFFDMKLRESLPIIALGVLAAGLIVAGVTQLVAFLV